MNYGIVYFSIFFPTFASCLKIYNYFGVKNSKLGPNNRNIRYQNYKDIHSTGPLTYPTMDS